MNRVKINIIGPTIFLLTILFYGCSTTPGDAARLSGNFEQAAELYQKGVDQGDAVAAGKLGSMIENGSLKDAKFGSAGSWYLKACDMGSIVGCHNAGVGFENGTLGLNKNIDKARELYQRGAEAGYMQSEYNLGSLYANKYFSNDTEGLKWLLASQIKAQKCSDQPLCKWILQDPPGHIAKLKARMSNKKIDEAKSQALNLK